MKPIFPLIYQSFQWRLSAHHSLRRLTLILAVGLVYGVIYFPMEFFWGKWISLLSIVPVALIGWFFGPAFGVFSSFFMLLYNVLLWNVTGFNGDQYVYLNWILLNLGGGGLIGYLIGRVGDTHYGRNRGQSNSEGLNSALPGLEAEIAGSFEAPISNYLDFLPGAAFAINRKRRICAWNISLENMTGIPAADILGKDCQEASQAIFGKIQPMLIDFVSGVPGDLEKQFPGARKENQDIVLETFIPDFKPGGAYLLMKARSIYNLDGVQVGTIQSIQDVTEQRLAQEREGLIEQRDTTTGLFTKNYFEKEIARLERNHASPNSILLVRLSDISTSNGKKNARPMKKEELLRRTATALKGVFRINDIVAYLGERDFAILVPRADSTAAQRLAERLRKSLSLRSLGRFEPLLEFNVVAVSSLESGTLLETFQQGYQLLTENQLSP